MTDRRPFQNSTPADVEKLKDLGHYHEAGQAAFEAGLSPDSYGAHAGLRSTRERAIRNFRSGWALAQGTKNLQERQARNRPAAPPEPTVTLTLTSLEADVLLTVLRRLSVHEFGDEAQDRALQTATIKLANVMAGRDPNAGPELLGKMSPISNAEARRAARPRDRK